MSSNKRLVTIKGVKDGLVFQLDDDCGFQAVLNELQEKLMSTHQKILEGPEVQVLVQFGKRWPTEEQKRQITELIEGKDNLTIRSLESDVVPKEMLDDDTGRLKVLRTIVRSGQNVHHSGDLLLLGDVNPGGTITSTGDIYVMGSLRGMAHAGLDGNENAIIVSSHLKPTQLRIAGVISRPPDEWGIGETFMEFAYLNNGIMEIDKIMHIGRVRPGGVSF